MMAVVQPPNGTGNQSMPRDTSENTVAATKGILHNSASKATLTVTLTGHILLKWD